MGLEARGHYCVSCGACGRTWREVRTGLRIKGRHVVAVCEACGEIKGVNLARTKAEVRRYLVNLLQAREKLLQSYEKGRARLEGTGAGRRTAERLARLRPPETTGLDEAVERAQKELDAAPDEAGPARCEACGKALTVHEEGTTGYRVPCPECGSRLSFSFVPPSRPP